MFLVNKKWIDEFKYIFNYNEILKIITDNKDINKENDYSMDKIIDLISNNLSENIKLYLNNLTENKINKN